LRDKVGLLATARKKAPHPARAVDFYQSPLFKKAVAYARRTYDRFYFYNAKDGLLLPDTIMYPYDVSIRSFTRKEREAWAERVVDALAFYESPAHIDLYLHGGLVYRRHLEPALAAKGFRFEVPLKGYGIGQQMKWYSERLKEDS